MILDCRLPIAGYHRLYVGGVSISAYNDDPKDSRACDESLSGTSQD